MPWGMTCPLASPDLPEDRSMALGSLADNTTHLSIWHWSLSGKNTVNRKSLLGFNFTASFFSSRTDVVWFLSSLVHFQPSLAFGTLEDFNTWFLSFQESIFALGTACISCISGCNYWQVLQKFDFLIQLRLLFGNNAVRHMTLEMSIVLEFVLFLRQLQSRGPNSWTCVLVVSWGVGV